MDTWEENQKKKQVTFKTQKGLKSFDVETFTWEKVDCIKEVKKAFCL